jgi:formylglycine-generating enzyme required for sulfatase activity
MIWSAALLALNLAAQPSPAAPTGKPMIQWIRIPGGTFTMGVATEMDSQPLHKVSVKTFEIAKTLVTNAQYRACVAAQACTAPKDFGAKFNGPDQPVVGVSWKQAAVFSKWVSGRLPSEAEWEYAAKSAGKDQDFPWGKDDPTCRTAVISGCTDSMTAPVCSKGQGNTEQGLCDMAGNIYEWVEDRYHGSYKGAPSDGSAWEAGGSKQRVVHGGSWRMYGAFVRAAIRDREDPDERANTLGFRPAR